MTIALWTLVAVLMAAGVAGTILPILPGAVLIFAGAVLGGWIDDWTRVSWLTLGVLALLTVLSIVVDYVSASLGAKRLGASPQAITGAALGTVLGVFTGLWGLLFMPLAGAAVGEYLALKNLAQAGRIGLATGLGLIVGIAVKLALAFSMIGIFVAALFF